MNDERLRARGAHATGRPRREWVEEQRADRQGVGRALRLTTLSALLPGSGLLRTRAWVLGVFSVTLVLAGTAAIAAVLWRNGLTSTALETAADERRLRIILGILLVGSFLWIAAVALTAVLTRPKRATTGQRLVLAGFTGLVCLALAAPAAVGTQYITSHLAAMDKVFGPQAGGTSTAGAEPTSALSSDPVDPWADLPRVNLLLLGSDAAEAREGTRTDTMIVASIDTHTGESVLFSIPRNLQRVPIPRDNPLHNIYPGSYDCGDQCLMNAIWTEAEANAEAHPEWYADDPTPGLTATREVLGGVLGLTIHHTVIVNLEGFEDLIDAMGGVTVTVKEPIPINGRTYTDAEGHLQLDPNSPNLEWLQPGTHELTGRQALGYSRSRVTTDDFSRMRRQRCMVAAVIDQADPVTLLQRYPQIITAVGDNVLVDIPQSDLATWAELLLLVKDSTIKSLPFTSQVINTADPDYSEIRAMVWEATHPSPPAPSAPEPEKTVTAAPTATPSTDDGAVTTPAPDDSAVTTTETDGLADIGAVCD